MNNPEQMMAHYLLGELSESEQADLEQRYFADSAVLDRLAQIECDLMDDYARDRLSPLMRERFEQVYLASPERRARLRFSEALVTKLDRDASQVRFAREAETASWWRKMLTPLFGGQRAFAFSMALAL